MLVSFAIASVLAAGPADAPPPTAPPPTFAPAPAPAPAPATTTTTTVVVPAPATATTPAAAAPTTVVVTTTTTPTPPPPPAPVRTVVMTPTAPVLSPPAPTWGPVQATPAPKRSNTEASIRKFRRGALGLLTIGGAAMGGAVGLQAVRARVLQQCLDTNNADSRQCSDVNDSELILGRYSATGMSMFVVATAGAGTLLGNAAATRDVQLNGRDARRRGGLKLIGAAAIGAASIWMIGANYRLARLEAGCGDDYGCVAKYRPLRWAANDGAALGIGAGAGILGWAIAYERQGKALMKIRAAPSVSSTHTGLALSGTF